MLRLCKQAHLDNWPLSADLQVDLSTRLTRNIKLAFPFASSPMDTVTESKMAIAMALQGCIGIIHCNCTAERQVELVSKVKSYENGFIDEPAVMSPVCLVSALDRLKAERNITGVPITEDGKMGSKLVGLITKRDTDLVEDRSASLSTYMTPVEKLVVGTEGISLDKAQALLKESKKGYLPIVDTAGNLVSLTTRTDLLKSRDYPYSTKDAATNSLRVGAAVGSTVEDRPRIDALVAAGVDVLCVDERNGSTAAQCAQIKYIKERHSSAVDVVGGNVVTCAQARVLLDAGADALRVGMGAGSVSTTQQVRVLYSILHDYSTVVTVAIVVIYVAIVTGSNRVAFNSLLHYTTEGYAAVAHCTCIGLHVRRCKHHISSAYCVIARLVCGAVLLHCSSYARHTASDLHSAKSCCYVFICAAVATL
eukprot:8167-Heterococcus_DN1.PRE.2